WLDLAIELRQPRRLDGLERAGHGIAPDHLKILTVQTCVLDQPSAQGLQLVNVLRRDNRVYVNPDVGVSLPCRVERRDAPHRLLKVAWDPADPVVRLGEAVQGEVEIDFEPGKGCGDEF